MSRMYESRKEKNEPAQTMETILNCCKPLFCAAAAVGALRLLYKWWLKPRVLRQPNARVQSFEGKVVLITGASQGIGEALARHFHAAGAKVILTARGIDRLKALVDQLNNTSTDCPSPQAEYRYLDVTEPNGIEELVGLSPSGHVDILVHNAGIAAYAACDEATEAAVRKQFEVNFFGPVNVTRMLEPHLSHGAVVVVINSLQGLFSIPFRSAYGASKHALKAYFDAYRSEHCDDRHVLSIYPSYVNTNLAANAIGADGGQLGARALEARSSAQADLNAGLTPDYVAQSVLCALRAGESEVSLGPWHHRVAASLRVLAKDVYFAIMARRARDRVGAVGAPPAKKTQ